MWISWLLKYDGYPPGVVVALLLHGILMYIFLPKDFEPAEQVQIQPISYVVASVVTQSPQRRQQLNVQRENDARQQERERMQRERLEADRQREQAAEAARQQEIQRQQQELADRQRQERLDREREEREEQERLERERAEERERELAQERERLEAEAALNSANNAAAAQSAENQMVSQYMAIIHDVVSAGWRVMPDARNGMLAIVQMRLTPTGEIISRDIVKSSGNANFDRSVLEAIDRAGSFPELKDMPTAVFERHFRPPINLEFTPEDLLR